MIGKKDLSLRMVERSKLNKSGKLTQEDALRLVDGIFTDIVDLVEEGERVAIRNFGTFTLKHVAPREFYCALTENTHQTKGGTKVRFIGKLKPPLF